MPGVFIGAGTGAGAEEPNISDSSAFKASIFSTRSAAFRSWVGVKFDRCIIIQIVGDLDVLASEVIVMEEAQQLLPGSGVVNLQKVETGPEFSLLLREQKSMHGNL